MLVTDKGEVSNHIGLQSPKLLKGWTYMLFTLEFNVIISHIKATMMEMDAKSIPAVAPRKQDPANG